VTRLRLLPACFLFVEAFSTVSRLAALLPVLGVYGPVALVVLAARGLAGALQVTGAWLLFSGQPPAAPIARAALLLSAIVTTLETGFRLAPSNADPSLRWWLVAIYWAYAIGLAFVTTRLEPRDPA
jgi:hypothetical protein